MCKGVAPLPLLADCWGATGSRTAGASRSRLLALGTARDHALVRMGRVSQTNRHGNCKQRYSKSLQHSFFLPRLCVKKATKDWYCMLAAFLKQQRRLP